MSIRKFFTPEKSKTSDERSSDPLENLLPSCSDEATYVANENVKDVIKKGIKRKRGNYCHYDDETRAEIGKYAKRKCRSRPVCALFNASLTNCPKVLFRTTQLKYKQIF